MDKKFKLVGLLSLVLAGLAIAWNTLARFFSGAGVNFVAVLAIFATIFMLVIEDKDLYYRTRDLFYVDLGIASFELLVFAMVEYFGRFGKVFSVFTIIQKVFSVFAILYFAYVVLKLLFVAQDRLGGVFYCLFHSNKPKKPKKAKELSNGSLSDKPMSTIEPTVLEGQVEIDEDDNENDEL